MKRLAIIVAVIATLGLLWVGGELHRQNCVDAHLTGCSILPWESGTKPVALKACNDLLIGCQPYLLPSRGYLLDDTRNQPWWKQP